MNELITNLEVKITPAAILFDLTPIKDLVSTLKTTYTGWVVKEEDLKAAADTTAQINKISKALSDKRIAIGKEYKKPYEEFEATIKGMCSELDDISKSIKSQTEQYELQRQETKRFIIKGLPNFNQYIVFDEKWLNKGAKIEDVSAQIEAQNNALLVQEHEIKDLCGQELDPVHFLEMFHSGTPTDIIKQTIDGALKAIHEPKPKDDPFFVAEKSNFSQSKQEELFVEAEFFGESSAVESIKKFAESIGVKVKKWEEI